MPVRPMLYFDFKKRAIIFAKTYLTFSVPIHFPCFNHEYHPFLVSKIFISSTHNYENCVYECVKKECERIFTVIETMQYYLFVQVNKVSPPWLRSAYNPPAHLSDLLYGVTHTL